ncbi:substrate-binding periplasmic protein [Spartinivicinus poritis]|uniref:Transporter substrate-binding domain-containing protein n=1 Tax=Spartinivicinus poritis TaxID=2994640 RepID=A0ABT5U5Y7_9GAMM|nr:transporter substrate-binding domain-containing protein [Spartinivicinus sp. A2-2]MDE1461781.1 transporter substrate-binding domain-containing protein [Spartinivicinus sp. A2-2]
MLNHLQNNKSTIYFIGMFFILFYCKTAYPNQSIKVVGTPEKPFRYSAANGEIIGIDAEILKIVFNKLAIASEFRLINVGSRIIKFAQEGKVDVVMSFSRKESRESYLVYPQIAYKEFTWNFFIRKEDENKIIYNSLQDLSGLTVGATQDWAYTPEFWQAELKLDIVSNNDLHIPKLFKKRIDIVPLNTFPTLLILQEQGLMNRISFLPKPLKAKPYYNAFSRASKNPNLKKVIDNYDPIVKKLIDSGEVKKLYKKHLGIDQL